MTERFIDYRPESPPGMGKSHVIKKLAKRRGFKVREIKLKRVKRKNLAGLPFTK